MARRPSPATAVTLLRARETGELLGSLGGHVAGIGFLIELDFLKGREKLSEFEIHSVLHY